MRKRGRGRERGEERGRKGGGRERIEEEQNKDCAQDGVGGTAVPHSFGTLVLLSGLPHPVLIEGRCLVLSHPDMLSFSEGKWRKKRRSGWVGEKAGSWRTRMKGGKTGVRM